MTEQKRKILESVRAIREKMPPGFKPVIAVIAESNYDLPGGIKILKKISYRNIPPKFDSADTSEGGSFCFAKSGKTDFLILKGKHHYYDGYSMRDIGHVIYTLRLLGIRKILSVEEIAHLNPRFGCGELALIYDHINLMGNNPLIGENDDSLGLRFPDMSDAYSRDVYGRMYKVFQDNKVKINESVYLGIIGPQTETEAEVRFYREIGSDVLGYSLAPENISAVHCGIKFAAIGLITRELIADKMLEDKRSVADIEKLQSKYRKSAQAELNRILIKILEII
ncbi:MAG: purine-nucleoside phosphorylase [Ignavibacteria bacterium]|jgi:purine-nucleoside phosphorylase|nr:purine-nucleoside phosphorylase [Ignavibacteria bacterium]